MCGGGEVRVAGGQELVACSDGCSLTSFFLAGWKLSVFDCLTLPPLMLLLIHPVALRLGGSGAR